MAKIMALKLGIDEKIFFFVGRLRPSPFFWGGGLNSYQLSGGFI
jgi:hypothetical protein